MGNNNIKPLTASLYLFPMVGENWNDIKKDGKYIININAMKNALEIFKNLNLNNLLLICIQKIAKIPEYKYAMSIRSTVKTLPLRTM